MTTQEELSNNESYDELNWFLDGAVEVDDYIEETYTDENTPWLERPVDNISMFDIADFSIEGKKTYFHRNNWNVVVWAKGKSIEMIPTDIIVKNLNWDESRSWSWVQAYSDFDFSPTISSQYVSAIENSGNKVIIKRDWIYKVSFKFWVEFVEHIEWYILWLSTSWWQTLFHKEYWSNTGIQIHVGWSCSGSCSSPWWWGSCSWSCNAQWTIYLNDLKKTRRYNSWYREWYMELHKWDEIQFVLLAVYESWSPSWTIKLLWDYTSWDIQYLKSNR